MGKIKRIERKKRQREETEMSTGGHDLREAKKMLKMGWAE